MKLQAQAVLRREDLLSPLRLAGVPLARSFHPLTALALRPVVVAPDAGEERAAEAAALRGQAGRPHHDHAVE